MTHKGCVKSTIKVVIYVFYWHELRVECHSDFILFGNLSF